MELKLGYKRTDVGVIPVDWTTAPLESVCPPQGLVRGPFGGALKKEFFVDRGFKVYEQKNAIYRNVELGDYYLGNNKYRELSRFAVSEGDFIVSCSGTIGKIYQIPKQAPPGVINQALLKIRVDERLIHDAFLATCLIGKSSEIGSLTILRAERCKTLWEWRYSSLFQFRFRPSQNNAPSPPP